MNRSLMLDSAKRSFDALLQHELADSTAARHDAARLPCRCSADGITELLATRARETPSDRSSWSSGGLRSGASLRKHWRHEARVCRVRSVPGSETPRLSWIPGPMATPRGRLLARGGAQPAAPRVGACALERSCAMPEKRRRRVHTWTLRLQLRAWITSAGTTMEYPPWRPAPGCWSHVRSLYTVPSLLPRRCNWILR